MADREKVQAFDEELERLLDGGELPDRATRSPLLDLAVALTDALPQERPSADFRARLKAELLEQYANNVRPFPVALRTTIAPASQNRQRFSRTRHMFVVMASAAAAVVALLVGYSAVHQRLQTSPTSRVAQVLLSETPTPLPTRQLTIGLQHTTPVTRSSGSENPPAQDTTGPHPGQTSPTPRSTVGGGVVAQIIPGTPDSHANVATVAAVAPSATHSSRPLATMTPRAGDTATPGVTLPTTAATEIAQQLPVTASQTVQPSVPTASPSPTTAVLPTNTSIPATTTPVPATTTPIPSAPPRATRAMIVATSIPTRHPQATRPAATATAITIREAAAPTATLPSAPTAAPTDQPATATSAVSTSTVPLPSATIPTGTATTAASATAAADTATNTATVVASNTPSPNPTNALPATSTPTQPPAPDTPVAPSSATVTMPTPNATFAPEPTLIAQVFGSSTPGTSSVAANQSAATNTPVPGPSFPQPAPANAADNSPLRGTQLLAAGLKLHVAGTLPNDPGLLPVIAPIMHDIAARQILRSYGLLTQHIVGVSNSTSSISATTVLNGLPYRAVLQAESYGYLLSLRLLAPAPTALPTQTTTFDAESNARAFLHAHNLDTNLQGDTVQVLSGITTVTFTTYLSNTFRVANAGALFSYTAGGVLKSADIHVVDDSTAPTVSGISADAALNDIAKGAGLLMASPGAIVDNTATITGTTILYVPVTAAGSTYLEPMYRFTGVTTAGFLFQIYVPAIDKAYLH